MSEIFNFVRDAVETGISTINSNHSKAGDTQSKLSQAAQQVMSSWIGGDEQAFNQEVQQRLIPAVADFIAALAGLPSNTSKATGIMDQADSTAKGKYSQWGSEVDAI